MHSYSGVIRNPKWMLPYIVGWGHLLLLLVVLL